MLNFLNWTKFRQKGSSDPTLLLKLILHPRRKKYNQFRQQLCVNCIYRHYKTNRIVQNITSDRNEKRSPNSKKSALGTSDGSSNVRSSMFDRSKPKIGCSSSITIR